MKKKLIYILFLGLLLVSCEEYYNPKLDVVSGLLVVESHVTNDPGQNYVKLTSALDFYNTGAQNAIVGAKVDLIEYGGSTMKGIESSAGYFTFPTTPETGKKYLLRITYKKDVFESDTVIMPPLPTIDTLYTNHTVRTSYRTDSFGGIAQIETAGRDLCIDAPIMPTLEYYKFHWTAIIQWMYTPPTPPGGMMPPPSIFGWITYNQTGLFNLAGPKQFSVSDQVKNHPILFRGYDSSAYLDSASQVPQGWIVIIDQYGISRESYDFHEKLNQQFSAEGSLFDPVLTQVYGNIHCKNDKSKLVAGFFDLNSYRQYRYFMSFGSNENSKVYLRRMNRYFDISNKGNVVGNPPEFWEKFY